MKIKILLLSLIVSLASYAQEWEAGITAGAMQYQGDLCKPQLEFSKTNMAGGLFGRYTLGPNLAVRGNFIFGKVSGDDKLSEDYDHAKRNLNFRSNIMELSAHLEYNFMKYVPGSRGKKFTPYISVGLGVFHFNPVTDDVNGNTVKLHDLKTEQNKSYSLTQVCFPVGGGLKWNVSGTWTLGLDYATRFLLTDHLDDVSGPYQSATGAGVTPQELALSFRGQEINPSWHYPIETPGVSYNRGDPKKNDTYLYLGLSLTKTFRKYACR